MDLTSVYADEDMYDDTKSLINEITDVADSGHTDGQTDGHGAGVTFDKGWYFFLLVLKSYNKT